MHNTNGAEQHSRSEAPQAYTVKAAARLLGLPRSTLYDLVRAGEIASVRFGQGQRRRILIEASAVEEFFDRNRIAVRDRVRGPRWQN